MTIREFFIVLACAIPVIITIAALLLPIIFFIWRHSRQKENRRAVVETIGYLDLPGAKTVTEQALSDDQIMQHLQETATDLAMLGNGNATPLLDGSLEQKRRWLLRESTSIRHSVGSYVSTEKEDRVEVHLQRYADALYGVVTSANRGKKTAFVQSLKTADANLLLANDHYLHWREQRSDRIQTEHTPAPIDRQVEALTSQAEISTISRTSSNVSGLSVEANSQATSLVNKVLTAEGSLYEASKEQLLSNGLAGYHAFLLMYRDFTSADEGGETRLSDAQARMQEILVEFRQIYPPHVLSELYAHDIWVVSEDLGGERRPDESTMAEQILLMIGDEGMRELRKLAKHDEGPVRYFAIKTLGGVDTQQAMAVLLNRVEFDDTSTCRMAALELLMGRIQSGMEVNLVRAMVKEIQRCHKQAHDQRVAGVTENVLTLLFGGGGIGGSLMRGAAKWAIDPLRTEMSRLKPLERLERFMVVYIAVLLSAPELPHPELYKLCSNKREQTVQMEMFKWWLPLLLKETSGTEWHQRYLNVVSTEAKSSDSNLRNMARYILQSDQTS